MARRAQVFRIDAKMNFDEFENLARLYVVGALEDGEEEAFQEARQDFGERADVLIAEFRQLNLFCALPPAASAAPGHQAQAPAGHPEIDERGRTDGDRLSNHDPNGDWEGQA